MISSIIADLIFNYRWNDKIKISQKNLRYAKRLIMAGSNYLFLSQGTLQNNNEIDIDSMKTTKEVIEIKESEESEPYKRQNSNNNKMEYEINESETVYYLYGTIKCSLLLLRLHQFEPFELN